ncbi:hypothetical protein [Streptomyces sp. NPDC018347]|uniref:hypothetical protein n=1 Tax=Streptomyces sp. NPDC018347 TaxID=3157193 RepID=UPI0033D3B2FE
MTVDEVRAPVPVYLGRVLDAQATAVGTCFQVAPDQGNWLLAGLLRRPDVPARIVRYSAAAALDWLDSRSPRTQTRLVDDLLCALLLRDDLDPEQQARTFDRAMTVSAAHVTARPTSRVLRILLVHPALDTARRALVAGMALRWLDVQGAHLRLVLPCSTPPALPRSRRRPRRTTP